MPVTRLLRAFALLLTLATVVACSDAVSPVAPGPNSGGQAPASSTCTFVIADDQRQHEVDGAGAVFSISVSASRPDCAWTAASNAAFLTTNHQGAVGTAAIEVLVAPNPGDPRTGQVQIAGQAIGVSQRTAASVVGCGATVTPTRVAMSDTGGTAQIEVTGVGKFCGWTASTDSSFLRITSPLPREGDGTVAVAVEQNDGLERTGSLSVAGTLVTVTQTASSICVTNVRVTPSDIGADGGTASVEVTARDGCEWQLESSESFVSIDDASGGVGNGTVNLTVAANAATATRSAQLSVGGRHATLTQAAASSPVPPPAPPSPGPPAPPPPPPPPPALPAPGAGTEPLFWFTSDHTDYIGGGSSRSYTSATARIEAYAEENGRAVYATIYGSDGTTWNVRVAASSGQRLSPGVYTGATRSGVHSGATPGIDISGDGRGCNATTGRFAVHSANVASNGTLLKIHVTFEQHCEGMGPALRGEFVFIRPPSALPPPTSSPVASFLSYVSDSADYIGGGQSATWTPATSAMALTEHPWGLELAVTPSGSPFPLWSIGMAVGGQVPGVGLYESASRYPMSSTGPTFSFSGDGRGCNELLATYQVHQLVRDSGGAISRLQVTFEQHCEKQTPALRGEIVFVRP